MATCQKIIKTIERLAPSALAEEWDNTGLQVGDPGREINSVLVTLDITGEVLQEAIVLGADLIVAHHPLIFKPPKKIRRDDSVGKLIMEAIQNKIDIYICHTNADSCFQGVNDCLAARLGLKNTEVLQPARAKLFKLVVFVPEGHERLVRDAMGDAGAGWLGQYSHCSFMTGGTGSFKPLEGAHPFIGTPGKLEEVSELRIETVVPEYMLQDIINKILRVHPYEEVAYDIYPIENIEQKHGLGRIGSLNTPMTLDSLADKIKEELNCPWISVSGKPEAMVKRVAVCGGSGGNLARLAKSRKAEVLVTGDVKYHEALEAKEMGMNIIDAGHNATERILVPEVAKYLQEQLNTDGEEITVHVSQIETNPWTFLIG